MNIVNTNRFIEVKKRQDLSKVECSFQKYGLSQSKGNCNNWFDSDYVMVSHKLNFQINEGVSSNRDVVIYHNFFFKLKLIILNLIGIIFLLRCLLP